MSLKMNLKVKKACRQRSTNKYNSKCFNQSKKSLLNRQIKDCLMLSRGHMISIRIIAIKNSRMYYWSNTKWKSKLSIVQKLIMTCQIKTFSITSLLINSKPAKLNQKKIFRTVI